MIRKYDVLSYLEEHTNSDFSAGEVASALGGSADALRIQLNRLWAEGLVTRGKKPGQRRRVIAYMISTMGLKRMQWWRSR